MTRDVRRALAGVVLMGLLVIAYAATWLAANGEPPCGWGIFQP